MSMNTPQNDLLQELVVRAFVRARESGKDEWDSMRPAVLKNRLLDLTNRGFDESDYDIVSVAQVAERMSSLVEFDESRRVLRLTDEGRAEVVSRLSKVAPQRNKIRPDLWEAIIDFSSGTTWVWDTEQAKARPSSGANDSGRPLPTISPSELSGWRSSFVHDHRDDLTGANDEHVQTWIEPGKSSMLLPPSTRGLWFEQLKQNVAERLTAWFESEGIAPPEDLFVSKQSKRSEDEAHRLRDLISACLSEMTVAELRSIPLPAHVLLRMR